MEEKIINNIKGLSLDMIDQAKSGHPGICLGAAPIIYTIYKNYLNFDLTNLEWINRDRFIMSAGHGSALLYSTLYMAGFPYTLDDLKAFRKLGSITPGHPERNNLGVEMATGPLGEGLASAVGIAIGESYLEKILSGAINFYTYVLVSDGDIEEGATFEAMALAGKLKLNKLIVLYDSNDITLDGPLGNSSCLNMANYMESLGWNYFLAENDSPSLIDEKIRLAKTSTKPTLIEVKTVIGKGSELEGTNEVHGKPILGKDLANLRENLDLRDIPFSPSKEAVDSFREDILKRTTGLYKTWLLKLEYLEDSELKIIDALQHKKDLKITDFNLDLEQTEEALRDTVGRVLQVFIDNNPLLIGGSADLSSSTRIPKKNDKVFSWEERDVQNIAFGIREHAMGAIANGLATIGLIPFVSTFLVFSDFLKPSLRLASIMDLFAIYIFSHDSIRVGEDGVTHQPVEQLHHLRTMINVDVYRPSDINEVIGTFQSIFKRKHPSVIITSRDKVAVKNVTSVSKSQNGAYIVKEEEYPLNGTIISTGEDLDLALEVLERLRAKGFGIRLVSMPAINIFLEQDKAYQQEVLGDKEIFVIEAASRNSWLEIENKIENLFTIDSYGDSGTRDELLEKFEFTPEKIESKIIKIIEGVNS